MKILDRLPIYDEPALIEGQVRGVKEVDLPNLTVERIHAKCSSRPAPVRDRHGQLEFDGIGSSGEFEEVSALFVIERRSDRSRSHALLPSLVTEPSADPSTESPPG